MKLYTTGILTFWSIVGALLANVHLRDGFQLDYPYLFWGGQGIIWLALIVMILYTVLHWNIQAGVSRLRFIVSLLEMVLFYVIAWIPSGFSWVFILICGVTEMYFIRKRAGLVKERKADER